MIVAETRTGLAIGMRQPRPTDEPFVMKSAIGYLGRCQAFGSMTSAVFNQTVARRVRELWAPGSGRLCVVACLPEDEDFIVGFAVGDPQVPLVDLLKVRQSYTGQGVASLLLAALGINQDAPAYITFTTPDYDRRRSYPLLLPAK